jgi:hypothetical protein
MTRSTRKNKHGQTYAEFTRECHRLAIQHFGPGEGSLEQFRAEHIAELRYSFYHEFTVWAAFDGFIR